MFCRVAVGRYTGPKAIKVIKVIKDIKGIKGTKAKQDLLVMNVKTQMESFRKL